MINYVFVTKVASLKDSMNAVITQYGGFFVNYASCEIDSFVVVRVQPAYVSAIVQSFVGMGLVIGAISTSGIQTCICLRGFMG